MFFNKICMSRFLSNCLPVLLLGALMGISPLVAQTANRTVKYNVHGIGRVAIVGITPARAKQIAIDRARADVIEKAVGIHLLGSTLVSSGKLVGEYIQTLSRGYIIHEKITWKPSYMKNKKNEPPVPQYEADIIADVEVPHKKKGPAPVLNVTINKRLFLEGEGAVLKIQTSVPAYIAVFDMRADDKIIMLYPYNDELDKKIIKKIMNFPSAASGYKLIMTTIKGHKKDDEAFFVAAMPYQQGKASGFNNYFKLNKKYKYTEFFKIYSRIADFTVERILPYEIDSKK